LITSKISSSEKNAHDEHLSVKVTVALKVAVTCYNGAKMSDFSSENQLISTGRMAEPL